MGGTLPGPAWRSRGLTWEWLPGELGPHPRTFIHSASAGLQGSQAGRDGLQMGGGEKVSASPVRSDAESGAVGEVSHILVILPELCVVQPGLFTLFFFFFFF